MQLIATLGPKRADDMGMILLHEHIFVDLRTWDQPGYAQRNPCSVLFQAWDGIVHYPF